MQTLKFGDASKPSPIAILIKEHAFNQRRIMTNYIDPLDGKVDRSNFMAYELTYGGKKKPTAAHRKEYIESMLPALIKQGVTTLFTADGEYFKTLTGKTKVDGAYGYVCDCKIKGYEQLKVILSPNYQAIIYNPAIQEKLDMALSALATHSNGTYADPGLSIIHSAEYPESIEDIKVALDRLHLYPELTCDIEGLSLKFWESGISTIAFAWDKHNGIAMPVDRGNHPKKVRKLVKEFLASYQGKLTYHNAGFDMKILVYVLWMNNLADYPGMLNGIEILHRNFDDTKLIAYLATNNAVKNDLKLKSLAHAYAGDYAQEDIKDTSKIPLPELLEYNLVDCLSTWYVKEKCFPVMVKDKQESLYVSLFKPAVKNILQMELCGMPIDPVKVQEARVKLTAIVTKHQDYFKNSKIIQDFHWQQLQKLAASMTKKAKKKVYTLDDPIIAREVFNPGSDTQVRELIYNYLGYDVIDTTDSGLGATGGDTLKKLINHTKSTEHKEMFEHLRGLAKADKILTSFIPAFEQAQQLPDGSWRLYGNFNLGGTQSGRLSSSNPNLQNIPSSSEYATIIKECFISPKGWIFGGADFEALEAKGNALLTKDPNRLKVYLQGYDSHCLNAYSYYKDQMPDIIDTVESINSIKKKYKHLRTDSKRPTFALQYEGTYFTLMKNLGISKRLAIQIYEAYHKLYVISDQWLDKQIAFGSKHGYVECAFGLRLRTPILAQTIANTSRTPYMAKAERRSAGNALSQALGILNSRAGAEFQELVLASPYRYDILPVAQIHDAIYLIWRDSAKITKWINDTLIKCMQWQELPEIQHDTIKMGAELDLFWPNWSNATTIPNNVTHTEIKSIVKLGVQKYKVCRGKQLSTGGFI